MTEVKTNKGYLRGCLENSTSGKPYFSFKGIPYARPPVGNLRYANPQMVQAWDGVKNADTYGPCSLQFDSDSEDIIGSEDCLYLNVFSRAKDFTEKLPVLVFIHGGGFYEGSGDDLVYGPQNAMEEKWIFITINYRLGPFGFMAPLGGAIPANLGLKDQRLALYWIKENISAFGGDPDNITLMGESAGSASAWFQYLHPSTDDVSLFHKLIMQSGAPICPWACFSPQKANTHAEKFLTDILKTETLPKGEELREKMVNMDLDTVKEVMKQMDEAGDDAMHPYFTVVTQSSETEDNFVTCSPMEHLQISSRWTRNIPTIIQLNKDEGGFLTAIDLFSRQGGGYQSNGFSTFYNMVKNATSVKEVQEEYFGTDENPKEFGRELNLYQKLTKLYGDVWFDVPVCIALQSHMMNNNVYLTRYAHQSSNRIYDIISQGALEDLGVSHFDEVLLLFKNKLGTQPSEDDMKVATSMWKMFYNFALTGKAHYETEDGKSLEVPMASSSSDYFLEIKSEPELKEGFKPEKFNFWKNKIIDIINSN